MNFGDRLTNAVAQVGVPIGIGLDPHLDRLPKYLQEKYQNKQGEEFFDAAAEAIVAFNEMAISAAEGRVAAVKPQFAFYEQLGSSGWAALEATCQMAKEAGLLIIGDAKRGDISSTAAAYAKSILHPEGPLGCDSVTLNPWMGVDVLDPFLPYCEQYGCGMFVLVRTTNPHSGTLQLHGSPTAANVLSDALRELGDDRIGTSGFSPVGVVIGAFAATEAEALRERLPHSWFLVPGMGAQGGTANQALAGRRQDGMGSLVVSSRSLLYPKGSDQTFEANPEVFISQKIHEMSSLLRL